MSNERLYWQWAFSTLRGLKKEDVPYKTNDTPEMQ
jgi:hypothetical protein